MSFIDSLTPQNTEEIRPGLFVQKTARGHRVVYPAAWKGKMNWSNLFFGAGFLKGFIWFLILMGLVWSYQHDVTIYKDFYEQAHANPGQLCEILDQDEVFKLIEIGEIQIEAINENTYNP